MKLIRVLLHNPIPGGAVLICLLLVIGLVVSDWLEKRRTRVCIKLRDDLKAIRGAIQHHENSVTDAVQTKQANTNKGRIFRIFRWDFAALSLAASLLFILNGRNATIVEAKADQSRHLAMSAAPFVAEEPFTITYPSPLSPLESIGLRLQEQEDSTRIWLLVDSGELFNGDPEEKSDVSALFELVNEDAMDGDAGLNSARIISMPDTPGFLSDSVTSERTESVLSQRFRSAIEIP